MRKFSLSPSTLNLYLDCPRCFWFHFIKGGDFKRPEPPTSTLPRGMDIAIKKHFDRYRRKKILPPEVSEIMKGQLVEEGAISQWRYWRTGLQFTDNDGSKLFGALDECLINEGRHIPVDYKTRGFDLKNNSTSYYIFQMSCYNFLLAKNGYKISEGAYLVFYIPKELKNEGAVQFNVEVKWVKTESLQQVYAVFRKAIDVLSLKGSPAPSRNCKFCSWALKVINESKEQLRLF